MNTSCQELCIQKLAVVQLEIICPSFMELDDLKATVFLSVASLGLLPASRVQSTHHHTLLLSDLF